MKPADFAGHNKLVFLWGWFTQTLDHARFSTSRAWATKNIDWKEFVFRNFLFKVLK
jgi:hypothetical protein